MVEELVLQRVPARSSRRSPVARRVELRQEKLQEQPVPSSRGSQATRTMERAIPKVLRNSTAQGLLVLEVVRPVQGRAICSCNLCPREGLQEAEGKRRV